MRRISAAQKQKTMTALIQSKAGRTKIAARVTEPLRVLRDYISQGRKALMVDELPDGVPAVYDTDIETPCYVIGEDAFAIEKVEHVKRITVPTKTIASFPTIPFVEVKERRYDVVSRIKKKVKDELFRKEDQLIFDLLLKAGESNTVNTAMSVARASYGVETIIDAMANIEQHGHRVDKIFLNPFDFAAIKKAGNDYFDPETKREVLKTGLMGTGWGAQFYMSREIPKGKILFLADPEYVGVMPVRMDLSLLPNDKVEELSFGWVAWENFGGTVHCEHGVQLLSLT